MIKKGDMVRFIHTQCSQFHPPTGTIGEALKDEAENYSLYVRWPTGTTPGDGCWFVARCNVEPVSCVETTLDMDCSCLAENLSELFDE